MNIRRRRAARMDEDDLLSRLYQQLTEQQAAGFAPGYDVAAGLNRYRAWLDEHAEEHNGPEATQLPSPGARRAGLAATSAGQSVPSAGPGGESTAILSALAGLAARPVVVTTDALLAEASLESVPAEWDAARAVTAIYTAHYRSLVRLAVLLVRDVATAEEVVQDSFTAMHAAWSQLRDTEKALSYLRQSVVNRSRSVLRHRVAVDKNAPKPAPDMPSAEQGAISLLERSAVIAALRTLPPRQREALVLKYYADLSEAQIAEAMGISRGAVKSHTARGVAALRAVLEMET
jgi:RNA polymerase sigma-70 factor (sigma-E family)